VLYAESPDEHEYWLKPALPKGSEPIHSHLIATCNYGTPFCQKGEIMMTHTVEKAIEGYLDAVEQVHGKAFRAQTQLRHTGGTDIVIALPEGHKSIVSVGRLNLMAEHLKRQTELPKAA